MAHCTDALELSGLVAVTTDLGLAVLRRQDAADSIRGAAKDSVKDRIVERALLLDQSHAQWALDQPTGCRWSSP